jgi:hypothetical protein
LAKGGRYPPTTYLQLGRLTDDRRRKIGETEGEVKQRNGEAVSNKELLE